MPKSGGVLASADFFDFKDQVIFERGEVLTQGGTPYSVFTPYKNAWLKRLDAAALAPWSIGSLAAAPGRASLRLPDADAG